MMLPSGLARLASEAAPDWIRAAHEHDGDGARRLLQRADRRRAVGESDIRVHAHEVCGVAAQPAEIAGPPANIDLEIAPLAPTQTFQALPEHSNPGLHIPIALSEIVQHRDPADTLALLRAPRQRPRGRRAAEQGDELAPPLVEHWAFFPR